MNTNHYDLGIICALREEYDAVIDVFGKDNWKKHQDNSFVLPYHTCKVSTSMVGQEYSICAVCRKCRYGSNFNLCNCHVSDILP